MEKCPKCGNKLSNIDVLCPRCGALVEVIQVKSSFIPPTGSTPVPSQKAERPNLVVYNEDLPGEGLFTETPDEEIDEIIDDTVTTGAADDFRNPSAFPMPDFSDLKLPEYETDQEEPGSVENVTEPQSDTRMARRARERQWLELEEMNSAAATPEAQLLKEADELTSRSAARTRTGYDSGRKSVLRPIPDATALPDADNIDSGSAVEEEPRRYRSRDRHTPAVTKSVSDKKLPAPAVFLIWAMLAAAVFLGFFYLNRYVQTTYGGYPAFIREITNGKVLFDGSSSLANSIDVTASEAQTDSGAPAHTFIVAAAGAKSVRVSQTGNEYAMEDGTAVFTIPDEEIAMALGAVTYDNTVKAENLNLEVTFGSSTQKYIIEPFDLLLIRSEYTREAPLQTHSSATLDVVTLSIRVAPESTVFINNVNYTDKVAEDGKLNTELKLESDGDNIFAIDVIQPGRQAVKDSFTVTRQAAHTKLEPTAEYQRVYSATFECRGTTEAGATLSAELNGKTFAGLVSESGAFSAACTVGEFGLYTIKLTAASPDKENNEIEIAVEYLPEFKDFSSKAQKKTIVDAVKNAAKLTDVSIRITGKPEVPTTAELAQKFSLKSASSELKCYYYGDAPKLSAESEYTFYGKLDETGQFYVMFVE